MRKSALNEMAIIRNCKISDEELSSISWSFDKKFMSTYDIQHFSQDALIDIRKAWNMRDEFFRATCYIAQYDNIKLRYLLTPILRPINHDIVFAIIVSDAANHKIYNKIYFPSLKEAIQYSKNIIGKFWFKLIKTK